MENSQRNTNVFASCWLPVNMQRNIIAQRRIRSVAHLFLFACVSVLVVGIAVASAQETVAPKPVQNHLEPSKDIFMIIEVRPGETNDQAEARTKREIRANAGIVKADHIAEAGKKVEPMKAAIVANPAARTTIVAKNPSKLIADRQAKAKVVCEKANVPLDPCVNDLVAMNWKETTFRPVPLVGDGGRSHGYFQIQLKLHGVTKECANDFTCAAAWTLDHLTGKGYPKYRTAAITAHNGSGPMAEAYAESVKKYAATLAIVK